MKQSLLCGLHILIYVIAYTSWLWVDFRIIALSAILHVIMLEVLRGCPLSRMQFPDDKEKRFYEWWLSKLGVNVTKTPERRRDVRIFMQYGMPVIIVLLGVLLQVVIGVNPLIRLP